MRRFVYLLWAAGLATGAAAADGPGALAGPVTRSQSFDRDPGWDHANNRPPTAATSP